MLIAPGNPVFKEIETKRMRYFPMSAVEVIKRDGKLVCAWCAEKELPPGKRKYCSRSCQLSFEIYAYPTKYPAIEFIYQRQKKRCAGCSYQYGADSIKKLKKYCSPERYPEFDHIVPVALGGQTFGIDNIQMLCKTCHSNKTKSDIKEIRRINQCSSSQEG